MAKTEQKKVTAEPSAPMPTFTHRKIVANYTRSVRFRSAACPKC